jgi:hypothetical protein
VFAVRKKIEKGVKERVKKEKSKKRGCLVVCVTKSLISIISSWWWFWTASF